MEGSDSLKATKQAYFDVIYDYRHKASRQRRKKKRRLLIKDIGKSSIILQGNQRRSNQTGRILHYSLKKANFMLMQNIQKEFSKEWKQVIFQCLSSLSVLIQQSNRESKSESSSLEMNFCHFTMNEGNRNLNKSHNKYLIIYNTQLIFVRDIVRIVFLPYLIYLIMILQLALLIALITSSQQKYTNSQAFQCFAERAFSVCSSEFQQCSQSPQCQSQLQNFSHCSFNDAEKDQQKIFNGYCFRRWHERAIQTRKVINCLNQTCNLLYNSQIGMAELYKCLQSTLLDKEVQCGDECENEIQRKIGMQMYEQPIVSLYNQEFHNQEAINLVRIVKEECLNEQGKGKEMIYNQEELKEQQRPKRNQQEEQAAEL